MPPKFARGSKYIILVLIVITLLLTMAPQWVGHKFTGLSLSRIFIVILFYSLAVSIFVYRPFCYNFCPIRALGEISKKLKNVFR